MTESQNTLPSRRVHALDALRSVAILMVMLWHLRGVDGKRVVTGIIGANGLWGVDLFFVLSGYLIGYQLFESFQRDRAISFSRFYLRRALRTWPNYFFVLTMYYFIPAFSEKSGMPPLWKFLTFTQNFGLTFCAFSHAWSLCIEEQFYFLFPLVSFLVLKAESKQLAIGIVMALLLSGAAIRGLLWYHQIQNGLPISEDHYFSQIYYPTWGRLDGLVLGVSIAALRSFWPTLWENLAKKGDWIFVIGIMILGMGFAFQARRYDLASVIFGFPVLSLGFAAIVVSALSPSSALGRLNLPGASILSTLSYSLYLLHKQIFHLSSDFLEKAGALTTFSLVVLSFTASFTAAAALNYIVERPFLKLRDNLMGK